MVIFTAKAINKKYGDSRSNEIEDKQMSKNRFIMSDKRNEFEFDRKITQIC